MEDSNITIMLSNLTAEQKEAVFNLVRSFSGENHPHDTWIGTGEAAEVLGVTKPTIRSYLLDGKLDGRRVSERRILVSKQSVDKLKLAQTRF